MEYIEQASSRIFTHFKTNTKSIAHLQIVKKLYFLKIQGKSLNGLGKLVDSSISNRCMALYLYSIFHLGLTYHKWRGEMVMEYIGIQYRQVYSIGRYIVQEGIKYMQVYSKQALVVSPIKYRQVYSIGRHIVQVRKQYRQVYNVGNYIVQVGIQYVGIGAMTDRVYSGLCLPCSCCCCNWVYTRERENRGEMTSNDITKTFPYFRCSNKTK